MNISEVIRHLQAIHDTAGDLPCVAQSETCTWHFGWEDLFVSRKEVVSHEDGHKEHLDRSVVIGYRH